MSNATVEVRNFLRQQAATARFGSFAFENAIY